MILQSLVSYYETLTKQSKIDQPGWSKVKISWALEIDGDGNVLSVLPLKQEVPAKKKTVPREFTLPAPVKKTSGEKSNFLWENAEYLLGMQTKDNGVKTEKRFQTAKELHLSLLAEVETPEAEAIKAYFTKWNPETDINERFSEECLEDLRGGSNLTFFFQGKDPGQYDSLRRVWQKHYDVAPEGELFVDLVTGELVVPEKIHPPIKNVINAQAMGASLVSFNARAYESYGRDGDQNLSAPMGKQTAFAYTAALNYLTSNRVHRKQIGDMTVVYWAKNGEEAYQDAVDLLLNGADTDSRMTQEDLNGLMGGLSHGDPVMMDGTELCPSDEFYILGISPNAARLAIRFFYRSTFGEIVKHIRQHYEDISIVPDHRNKWLTIPLGALLKETVNQKSTDKTPLPQMAGDVLRAVMTGGRYPRTLFNQTLLRIRAEQDITRGRAAIIKACLIRNTKSHKDHEHIQEVTGMALNEESNYTPYVLGRLFSVLEETQQSANPGIKATIKDRYFNSACSTPAAIFPLLMKLSNSHLKKLDTGKQIYLSKKLSALTDKLDMQFPKTLALEEQGAFILGYYHQTQNRFVKNNQSEEKENV